MSSKPDKTHLRTSKLLLLIQSWEQSILDRVASSFLTHQVIISLETIKVIVGQEIT